MLRRLFVTAALLMPVTAVAHVKWFEEYEVAQEPVPIGTTLSLPYFWAGLGLVLLFFIATAFAERRQAGVAVTRGLDRLTAPLRDNADAFFIWVLVAFFVALFAVGGTYLTPDLKTDSELVPWIQLLIGLLIIARRTRPIAAVAIIILWLVTMGEYDLFHLYDYLALGLGIAAYLLLSGFGDGPWHARRFAILRWGIALALMWSAMEKFMYPQWFLPLLEEKPFLAFGIPFAPYTTMAGVAEFALGFGLLWTPLVRRLSAAALFVLMFAAVYPFGRVDMIGHATILAALLVILADPLRDQSLEIVARNHRAVWFVPVGLAIALAVTMLSYSGQHHLIYDRASGQLAALLRPESQRPMTEDGGAAPGAFWRGQEHYHGRSGMAPDSATAAMMRAMDDMQSAMNAIRPTGDVDRDFAAFIVPHRNSAADLARAYLAEGRDPQLRAVARAMLAQEQSPVSNPKQR